MKTAMTTILLAAAATPVLAQTGRAQGPMSVFADAGLLPKAIMAALLLLIIAALVVCARKISSGAKLSGGSHFLSSLRAGGPLLGLLGAGYGLINNAQAIAVLGPQPLQVMMPGIVESLVLVMLGLIAGVVAVVAHWAVEARIDREVLKA